MQPPKSWMVRHWLSQKQKYRLFVTRGKGFFLLRMNLKKPRKNLLDMIDSRDFSGGKEKKKSGHPPGRASPMYDGPKSNELPETNMVSTSRAGAFAVQKKTRILRPLLSVRSRCHCQCFVFLGIYMDIPWRCFRFWMTDSTIHLRNHNIVLSKKTTQTSLWHP